MGKDIVEGMGEGPIHLGVGTSTSGGGGGVIIIQQASKPSRRPLDGDFTWDSIGSLTTELAKMSTNMAQLARRSGWWQNSSAEKEVIAGCILAGDHLVKRNEQFWLRTRNRLIWNHIL